ncbi:MAG: alkyl sulfatase dimerization domain-containing protein [Acidimicrobiales bacterium]
MTISIPQQAPTDSFDTTGTKVGTGPKGQIAHVDHIAHSNTYRKQLHAVGDSAWAYVGSGLSNQVFVRGPEGLIAIDSGESNQEMQNALTALREVTDSPIVSLIYTHSHYVSGTEAIVAEMGYEPDIWGHAEIITNRAEVGLEHAPIAGLGAVHQFGLLLPPEGPDAMVNCGLGPWFKDPDNAPHTQGYIPPNKLFEERTTATIAGLEVTMIPASSDASDSITIWIPELRVAINNLLWPAIFNVFPIRGERFRDPTVLLTGLDELGSLGAEHLIGCHGPPISGKDYIVSTVELYRDSIQLMLDQTVRGMNAGFSIDELAQFVTLPDKYGADYFTSQLYGLVEHHIKQIYTGLRGWFDSDAARLFPLPPTERANKLIAGFGGKDKVRSQIESAVAANDLRWALEMATWLVKCEADATGRADGGDVDDRALLASILRSIGQRTTSANIRNWCLTRALELDGSLDLTRFRTHRFSVGVVMASSPADSVRALRVLYNPAAAPDEPTELVWNFDDGTSIGLTQRNGVAIPAEPSDDAPRLTLSHMTWAKVLAGKLALSTALASGEIVATDAAAATTFLAAFDPPAFHA